MLVARRKESLEELRAELLSRHAALQIEIQATDLSQPVEVDALISWAAAQQPAIDLLINNAGLGDYGSIASADPERLDEIMQVNVIALTRLTRAMLPCMIQLNRGAILNVSSSAAFLPIPNFAVYSATKAYVNSFSEALRSEVRSSGIHVSALCPGPVRTEFKEVAQRESSQAGPTEPGFVYVPVEQVVADALRGIERNQPIVIPGLMMRLGMFVVRLTPMPVLRLASGLIGKRVQ